MKAVGLTQYLPIEDDRSLRDVEIDQPIAREYDLLVEVKAISVNPVDTKVRSPKDKVEDRPRILGWDAAGIVVEVGEKVTEFKAGDEVYYAGDITRPGSNSNFQLVDERIVGYKPKNLEFATSAALPLTSITAWEALFERLNISKNGADAGKSILIINGAGGVGSIAIQLARKLAKLNVIATASRPETIAWCQKLGANAIVNHHHNLADEIAKIGYETVDYILCLNDTDGHWQAIAQAIKPQGIICTIVENKKPLEMDVLKNKSAGLVWEFMFTRSMYQTDDMAKQGKLLNQVSQLIEAGTIITTCNDIVKPINAKNLRNVHQRIEKGSAIGKIVLADWN
ncbi:zinc-binding alcohol dehydrogenase family protein [Pleurocapsa sp. FMAR1]|uniref:zinc-binding alcohol dehydrogenase family protein n=1 Tax=Pleurocapsa sp. FMAR1 TaxID=3040204 RepID=UPI0029C8E5A5|nr:zinc-binding alcohol dehydrogenase family protein [Pleurocapsa sp. FMAR1]